MSDVSRRSFVGMLGAAVSGVALPDVAAEEQPKTIATRKDTAGRRPNIIVMICDDIGSGDLGCYGSDLQTPNLDRMAAEGALFRHYDTVHPICSASRAAVMTGRYANRNGNQEVYFPNSKDGLNLDEVTIANVLHGAKYKSMCVGKWHLGHMPEYLPTSRGFDEYFGVPYSVDMRPLPLIEGKKIVEPETDRTMLTPRYTDAAVKFIEKQTKDEPFFLYVAYSYPHIPIAASPRFKGKSAHGIYGDAVEEIDWSAGEILNALGRKGMDENTLVMFTGDHGPWYQGSVGNRLGRKGSSYEGGCRVPMVARWKGTIPAGHVCNGWATHLDLMPTFVAMAGAKLPKQSLDGVDMSSLLTGGQELEHPEPVLYFSSLKGYGFQCARKGKWKVRVAQWTKETYMLGRDAGENLALVKPELYDLDNDPGESYDMADRHPEIVKAITATLDGQIATFPEHVVTTYNKMKSSPAHVSTPAGSPARLPTYAALPRHYDAVDN
jgi:arylsulfatase A